MQKKENYLFPNPFFVKTEKFFVSFATFFRSRTVKKKIQVPN